jgi:putative ABC transport system permease protein
MLGRTSVRRRRAPIWERFGLDFILLAVSAFVYWQAGHNGYQIVLATEGAPRVAVSYSPFIAPLFLWAGAVLLVLRLMRLLLVRGRAATGALVAPFVGRLSSLVSAALSRQTSSLLPGVALVMLAIAFAISTATFNSTYAAQTRVDAVLTNGADVTVTGGSNSGLANQIAPIQTLPGVSSVEPVQHRFAYVGNDLQDIFGINPGTIGKTATLSNAFFSGGTANELMMKLAGTPDGVLVSQETVTDYQLVPGCG